MRQVKFGQSDKHSLRSISLIGFIINAFLVHTTVNTAFVLTVNVTDFAQITVSAELKRGGRRITVFNDVVYPLAQESSFRHGNYDEIRENTCIPQVLVVQTGALFHTLLMTANIQLHDVINLKDDDELLFEITPNTSGPIATVSQANSWIEWDVIEGIGNGLSVPILNAESIRPAETTTNIPCGDNVISVHFINKDKIGITTANQVLQMATLNSDKIAMTDVYNELLAKRSGMFPSTALGQARDQSFRLIDVRDSDFARSPYDVRLHAVNLRLNFTPANVVAGKNWVVIRSYENDFQTLQEAKTRNAKHAQQNNAQYQA